MTIVDSNTVLDDDKITEKRFISYVSEHLRARGIEVPEEKELKLERWEENSILLLIKRVQSYLEIPRIICYEESRPYGVVITNRFNLVSFEFAFWLEKYLSKTIRDKWAIEEALREFDLIDNNNIRGEISISAWAHDDKHNIKQLNIFKRGYLFNRQESNSSGSNSYSIRALGLDSLKFDSLGSGPIKKSIEQLVEFYDSLRRF